MSQTPFAHAESLRIGTVEFVSPDVVKVSLDIEAPEAVALNAGGARPFPRVNGYVLIAVDESPLVAQIEWITVERSPFPKRRGVQDFGLVDLPYPLRKMSLNPLGSLRRQPGADEQYVFMRGAESFPSIGAAVLLPTEKQLRAIVESGEKRRVRIGTSPLAANAQVYIDPDRLFGRHLAVLGNTGSGKSCSVAGLIRWSLAAAQDYRTSEGGPNARFIILDPNGEYARAFSDAGQPARIFRASGDEAGAALKLPLWFWNSGEWASFTQASARTQRPLLRRALREVKGGRIPGSELEDQKLQLRRFLTFALITVQNDLRSGTFLNEESKFGYRLKAIADDLRGRGHHEELLHPILTAIEAALDATYHSFWKDGEKVEYYRAFTERQVQRIVASLAPALSELGGTVCRDGPDEDVPLPFKGTDLADHLEMLARQENVIQWLDFLVSRMRTFLADARTRAVIADGEEVTLEQWLNGYIGGGDAGRERIVILDLSLVPADVLHTVTAVAARMIFEALQRYRKLEGAALPTVLVMEEAHTFVRRYKDDVENYDAATVCCQVFERIAREGRKFGLGLVLSSQRPSELSPTVLSQCNSFLLHRISNDKDQELVHRLVPDNLRGLLRELPSLPSQYAVLLGWAAELPTLVRLDDLAKEHQPHSDDPDFWHVWTGEDELGSAVRRDVNWDEIAREWRNPVSRSEGD